jgi:hypothetical protein
MCDSHEAILLVKVNVLGWKAGGAVPTFHPNNFTLRVFRAWSLRNPPLLGIKVCEQIGVCVRKRCMPSQKKLQEQTKRTGLVVGCIVVFLCGWV